MASKEAHDNPDSVATEASTHNSQVPEWLTADKFNDILRKNFPGYQRTRHFKAYSALPPGENYATLMLRVEIEVELEAAETRLVSYMLKVPLDMPMIKEMMDTVFLVERGMYLDVVPEMEQMFREVGVEVKFGAQCFELSKDIDCVLLEDLRSRGFKNADRLKGLDMEHTKRVLKKLAQWHAASATRVQVKGKYADCYNNSFFKESNAEALKAMFEGFAQPLTKCFSTYEGYEVYGESVTKLQSNIVNEMMQSAVVDENEFNVLNHGDCWCNNVMFQYDEFGEIKETYLVDYQIPKFGTPAQDLFYFLLSSTHLDLKLKHFDFFIKFYHDNLVKWLQLLKYPKKIPTLKDIHIMLVKYGFWGYTTATGVMAAVLLDPTESANLDNFLSNSDAGTNFKILMYSNPRYRKHIEAVLMWLHNRGALESSI